MWGGRAPCAPRGCWVPSRGGVADIVDVGGVVVAVVVAAAVVVVVVVVFRCYRRPSSSDVTDVLLSILFITPMTYMQDGLGWAGLSRTGLGWACRSWAGLGNRMSSWWGCMGDSQGICGGFRGDSCRFGGIHANRLRQTPRNLWDSWGIQTRELTPIIILEESTESGVWSQWPGARFL